MRGRAAKGNVTSAVSHKGGAHGVRARGMSVSQVIAGRGGSLNRGSHLSGDTCHMMPCPLARRAGRTASTGGSAAGPGSGLSRGWDESARDVKKRPAWDCRGGGASKGPHRAGVGPVRPGCLGRRAGLRVSQGVARLVPTPMGTSRPVRGVPSGGGPTAFGSPSGATAPRSPCATAGAGRRRGGGREHRTEVRAGKYGPGRRRTRVRRRRRRAVGAEAGRCGDGRAEAGRCGDGRGETVGAETPGRDVHRHRRAPGRR